MYDDLFSVHIIYLLKEKATTKCFREGVGPPQAEQLLMLHAILPTDILPFGVFMMVVEESLV